MRPGDKSVWLVVGADVRAEGIRAVFCGSSQLSIDLRYEEGASTMPLKLVVFLCSAVFEEIYAGVGIAVYLRDQLVGLFLNF